MDIIEFPSVGLPDGSRRHLWEPPRWRIYDPCGKRLVLSAIPTQKDAMSTTGMPTFDRFAAMASCLLAASLLVGCAWYERQTTTTFAVIENGFEYKAIADADHKLDDPDAERWRLGFLETYLEENHICPAGYTIRKRSSILRETEPGGDFYDVFYEGRCNG
jgi:hypothetical protein